MTDLMDAATGEIPRPDLNAPTVDLRDRIAQPDNRELIARPPRYRGKHRPRRLPIASLAALIFGGFLMVAAAVAGVSLKAADESAAPVVPAEPWVAPSHPVGTGESLYLRGGVR